MSDTLLLTVLLRHDQSKNLDEIQARMKAMDWWERFPGEGVEIVSWTVAMGLGQIVTFPDDFVDSIGRSDARSTSPLGWRGSTA